MNRLQRRVQFAAGQKLVRANDKRLKSASALPPKVLAAFEACVRSTFLHGNPSGFEVTNSGSEGKKVKVTITLEDDQCVGPSDKT